jgi:HEAT repeat protein
VKKGRFIAFAVLVVCLLIGISVAIRRSRESVIYRGQSLKTWSLQAYRGDSNAVVTLKELGTNAIPELLRLLKTKDSFFRQQTWTHLPRLPRRLRQAIARRFPPPQAEAVREAAARSLGRLGTNATVAIPALSRALRDNQGRVCWEAATALAVIGKDSIPVLINALDEKDARVRHAAADALGRIGPEAVAALPPLVRRLTDQDLAVRSSAAYSLTMIGTRGVLAVVDAAEQGEAPARAVTASLLTNSYLPLLRVSSELFKLAQDESPATRQRAIEALRAIRVAGGLAIHASMTALNDPVMEVRLAAIRTLGARGGSDEGVVRALTGCLNDASPRIREEAARALGNLGAHARAALPELTRLAQAQEETVSAAAKGAMGRIGQSKPDDESAPQR